MRKSNFFIILVFASTLLSSCATLLSGTSDRITFESEPPGAEVYVDGTNVGKTNSTIEVKRKYVSQRKIEYRLDNYEILNFEIKQKIDGKYWLNVLVGAVPMLVDIATGAALKPKETSVKKSLTQKK